MKSNYSSRIKTYTIALGYLNDNKAITSEVPEIAALYNEAVSLLEEISMLDKRKSVKITGISESKKELQDKLAQQALAMAKVISSYATKKKDTELKLSMNFTRTELFYGAGQRLGTKSNIILAKARELTAELERFGVLPDTIENFAGTIEAYRNRLMMPRIAISERKEANMQLNKSFRRLQLLFSQQLDPLILLLKEKHPLFYDTYLVRRLVINPAHHKTRVEGLVSGKDSRLPLAGVMILLEGVNMEPVRTDESGKYSLQTPMMKKMPVKYMKAGYKTMVVETVVKRGKVTIQNVELEPE